MAQIEAYRQQVGQIVDRLLATSTHDAFLFRKALIQAIAECFHLPTSSDLASTFDSTEQAKVIFDHLFGFSVTEFIQKYVPDKTIAKSFLIELLYGLYYGAVAFAHYKKNDFEFLVLQVLAEKMSLENILNSFSVDKTTRLIAFLFRKPREGTFKMLKHFCPRYQSLLQGLLRYYFDADLLSVLVDTETVIDENVLARIEEQLERNAQEQTREFFESFKELVPMIVASLGDIYKGLSQVALDSKEHHATKLQHDALKKSFAPFYARDYSYENFLEFTRLFGLKMYPCLFIDAFSENTSVVAKTKSITQIVSGLLGISRSVASLVPEELQKILSFVLTIIAHLDATIQNPQIYKDGLDHFTASIPTSSKELENEPAVFSVLNGLQKVCEFLQNKGIQTKLADYPIVIFDQSEGELFSKNEAYVQSLMSHYACTIFHVSKKDARLLAEKLGAEKLLITMPNGSFGFGGARNCQFFLTGVIRGAFKAGYKTIGEIAQLPQDILKKMFKENVLGGTPNAMFGVDIFAVDDDMQIADATLFSCALFANMARQQPLGCIGYQLGRASKYYLFYWDLSGVLESPEYTTMFPLWLDYQTLSGLSEHLLKPKICLNLPQGNEENHYLSIARGHSFLQPSFHLCGSRYPNQEIPTHFFVGLHQHLEKAKTYVLFLYLSDYLLAPKNPRTPTGLPWNDDDLSAKFLNLQMGLHFIAADNTQKQLQKRFWNRVKGMFCERLDEFTPFLGVIEAIRTLDVDATCSNFEKQVFAQKTKLTEHEKGSLVKLGNVYKACQEDMNLFWQLGTMLGNSQDPELELESICKQLEQETQQKLSDYPITHGLYLMAHSVGKGEFCQIVKNVLLSNVVNSHVTGLT